MQQQNSNKKIQWRNKKIEKRDAGYIGLLWSNLSCEHLAFAGNLEKDV